MNHLAANVSWPHPESHGDLTEASVVDAMATPLVASPCVITHKSLSREFRIKVIQVQIDGRAYIKVKTSSKSSSKLRVLFHIDFAGNVRNVEGRIINNHGRTLNILYYKPESFRTDDWTQFYQLRRKNLELRSLKSEVPNIRCLPLPPTHPSMTLNKWEDKRDYRTRSRSNHKKPRKPWRD